MICVVRYTSAIRERRQRSSHRAGLHVPSWAELFSRTMEHNYDVIIIGSGLGGLSAAALLAQQGVRVLVTEKHTLPGGYCTAWQRSTPLGVFTFDAGIHDVCGLGPHGGVRNLLQRLGAEDRITWARSSHTYILADRLRIDVPPNMNDFVALLCQRFPRESAQIQLFFRDMALAYAALFSQRMHTGGVPLPPINPEDFAAFAQHAPDTMRLLHQPFLPTLDLFFKDETLKQIIALLSVYITDSPATLRMADVIPLFSYYIDGGFYPVGSTQVIADTLVDRCTHHGGRVLLRTPIGRILVEHNAVVGVETEEGIEYRAPWVISNADVKHTLFTLLGTSHLPNDFAAQVTALRPANSAFSVFLGLNTIPHLAPITIATTVGSIAIPSLMDPTLAPSGHACMTLTTFMPTTGFSGWDRASPLYKKRRRHVGNALIAAAEHIIPDLRHHIVYRQDASPATFARYTGATHGSIYGLERGQWAPPCQTPIKGLLLAGSGVNPGPGVEAVIISGTIAADTVLGQRGLNA